MRDMTNIRDVAALGIDLMGFMFYHESPRFVRMISAQAGIIPDYSEERLMKARGKNDSNETPQDKNEGQEKKQKSVKRVGVFIDDMPQNIVTRVYNYRLDYVQLNGTESPVMIDNLRRSLVPDIQPDIKIIKTIYVRDRKDIEQWKIYENHADMFLFDTKETDGGLDNHFDWNLLEEYKGDTPFLLGGGIGPDDTLLLEKFQHPRCMGIDLNSRFETAPAMKDVELLKTFLEKIRP